jgi:dTDP-4-dehydrorhamnose reductase
MNASILIIGEGMLGKYILMFFEVCREMTFDSKNKEFINKDCPLWMGNISIFNRNDIEATNIDFSKIEHWIKNNPSPHFIINTIMCRDKNDFVMYQVNGLFPRLLGQFIKLKYPDIYFIQISSDSIFSASNYLQNNLRTNELRYGELSKPNPSNSYGHSKLLGEDPNYLCIRTSIIGEEFDREPRSLLSKLKTLSTNHINSSSNNLFFGFSNCYWNGITTLQLAKIIYKIIYTEILRLKNEIDIEKQIGVIHVFSNAINKYELCQLIKNIYDLKIDIKEAVTNDFLSCLLTGPNRFNIPSIENQIIELRQFSYFLELQ